MNRNIALITGVTGQDGSYLSEFLLEKGYEVHGIIRRSSVDFRERIAHLEGLPNFHLHYADMTDSMSLVKLVGKVQPTEIYNLAAQSHVQVSFDAPEFTADVDAVGVLRILEAVRTNHLEKTDAQAHRCQQAPLPRLDTQGRDRGRSPETLRLVQGESGVSNLQPHIPK